MCVWVVGFNFAIECKCLIVGIVICKQKNVRHAERITVHGIFFWFSGLLIVKILIEIRHSSSGDTICCMDGTQFSFETELCVVCIAVQSEKCGIY